MNYTKENIEFIDEIGLLPQHLSILKDCCLFRKEIDMWDVKDNRYRGRGYNKVYNYTQRFWEKHLGENYNDCISILFKNVNEKFKVSDRSFYDFELHSYDDDHRTCYDNYCVKDGKVAITKTSKWKRNKNRNIVVVDNTEVVGVILDKKNYPSDVLDFIFQSVGRNVFNEMFNEMMSYERFKKLTSLVDNCFYYLHNSYIWKDRFNNIGRIDWCFDQIKIGDYFEVGRKSNLGKKIIAEGNDKTNKSIRDNRRSKKQQECKILSDLMKERKRQSKLEDEIKLRKHGFDENSFRGESYHGQKRKKK